MYHRMLNNRRTMFSVFIIVTVFLAVNAILASAYRLDNKYNRTAPKGAHGTIRLNSQSLTDHSLIPLIDGWNFYPDCDIDSKGRIVSSSQEAVKPRTVFLGQYPTFSAFHEDKSPYGQGVYELSVNAGDDCGPFLLLLTELFSACRIWVNDMPLTSLGQTSRELYEPKVQNLMIPIPSGSSTIRIAVSNYTHYYSGMTYPPLLGRPEVISALAARQLGLYGLLCFFTLGAAAASVIFWLLRPKSSFYFIYGVMCLSFSLHVSYPFLTWSGVTHLKLFYGLEDLSYWIMLLCMAVITRQFRKKSGVLDQAVLTLCIFFCLLSLATHGLFTSLYPQWINLYGILVPMGKCTIAVYLLGTSAKLAGQTAGSKWLISGNLVFASGIFFDFLTSGYFEPMRYLWPDEYSGFFIVLCFTALMISYHLELSGEHDKLTMHLEEEVEKKTGYLTALLNERRRLLSGIAHDMKAPVAVIKTYIDLIREEGISLDEETDSYLKIIDNKSSALEKQLVNLQLYNRDDAAAKALAACSLFQLLSDLYQETTPCAEALGIHYFLHLPDHDRTIQAPDSRMLQALENIVLNGIQHTLAEGEISVGLTYESGNAVIQIKDTGKGIAPEILPHIFEYGFTTNPSGPETSRGLGLYFAKSTIQQCNGSITAASGSDGTVFTITLPISSRP